MGIVVGLLRAFGGRQAYRYGGGARRAGYGGGFGYGGGRRVAYRRPASGGGFLKQALIGSAIAYASRRLLGGRRSF
jgi:hypothetical protein